VERVEGQPELAWWSQLWRYALMLFISGIGWFQIAQWQIEHRPLWFWIDGGLGLVCFVIVWWRREHPIAVNVLINALSLFSASSGGPATLALMSLATRRRWREIVPIGAIAFTCGLVQATMSPINDPWALNVSFLLAVIGVTVGWGLYVGSRRELLATLRDRAARAEAEQAARVAQARNAERARIAREMHDVMAHRISLVTMHAGALAFRDDLTNDQVKQTAHLIQQTSHQALEELREVLGLLREGVGDAEPEPPQPSAGDIRVLVDEATAAGMSVRFAAEATWDGLPETTGRTLYRVIQEALTNARKHAPGTTVAIDVRGGPGDGIAVRISNPMPFADARTNPLPGSGLGLVGLAERAELVGGRLTHRTSHDGTFVVEGWLPWPA